MSQHLLQESHKPAVSEVKLGGYLMKESSLVFLLVCRSQVLDFWLSILTVCEFLALLPVSRHMFPEKMNYEDTGKKKKKNHAVY